eukprot:Blabericola_migrator_1__10087@NODE_55_length_16001_cov_154_094327_g51_i0_p16_GENE_NODE_55_length_16001_cov_154_094327_g51_i0NODE_55_length_16001_cov_154_094327_g51_i0_p16_ORF_typecomplete_len109_score10_17zfSAP30/PF13866_6/0_041DUF3811/PF11656_8/0_046Phage_holin_8/PF16931_5/0_13_NODE_55_length_16001_cov_154_094327_g51_i031603486
MLLILKWWSRSPLTSPLAIRTRVCKMRRMTVLAAVGAFMGARVRAVSPEEKGRRERALTNSVSKMIEQHVIPKIIDDTSELTQLAAFEKAKVEQVRKQIRRKTSRLVH